MIEKMPFGKTGHHSSRAIFGSVSIGRASQSEADRALDLLCEFGVNHIDTAPKIRGSRTPFGALDEESS